MNRILKEIKNEIKWDLRFLRLAHEIATWSKDPTTKVGCVIIDSERRIVGTGYNGFPRLVPDFEEYLKDKTEKRLRVIHAEMNAMQFSTGKLEDSTLYCTHHPCAPCAGIIIQKGISRVVVPKTTSELGSDWLKSVQVARSMFVSVNVEFEELDMSC
jgi:dCMP deaminase